MTCSTEVMLSLLPKRSSTLTGLWEMQLESTGGRAEVKLSSQSAPTILVVAPESMMTCPVGASQEESVVPARMTRWTTSWSAGRGAALAPSPSVRPRSR